jgi:uncharacterized protein
MSRFLQFALFFSVVLLLDAAVHYWYWARLVRDTDLPAPWRYLITVLLLILALSLPLSMMLSRTVPTEWVRFALTLPMIWMGSSVFLITLLGIGDLCHLGIWLAGKVPSVPNFFAHPGNTLFYSRLVAGAALAISGVLTVWSVTNAAKPPEIKELKIVLDRLPRSLNGFTIVQITDLHMGSGYDREWLEDVVARVNALKPDVVVLTGDLMDGPVRTLASHVAPLAKLRAPAGAYFVTGNHEYYSGISQWLPHIEKLGFRILGNARVSVGRGADLIDLAGVWDEEAYRFYPEQKTDVAKALAGRDRSREVILLAHQPKTIRQAAENDVGLMLSGHTHGGQIWPFGYLTWIQQPFIGGLHRVNNTQLYVSEGTGLWGPPMRLGTSSEITLITLMTRP